MRRPAISADQPKEIAAIDSVEDAVAALVRAGAPAGLVYGLIISTRHGGSGYLGMRPLVTNLPATIVEQVIDPMRIMETPFFTRFSLALLPGRFHLGELRPGQFPRDRAPLPPAGEQLEGIAFPIHVGTGLVTIVALLGTHVKLDAEARGRLHLFALHLVDRLRELAGPAAVVSRRQLDCMRWIAAGKTSQEIADLLEISEHTVNHHIAAACTRLGAATRAEALAKLLRMNAL